ncbi:MAG: hypothetical protein ABSG91_09350 [Syntrophobacteraceae bacterium]|jgi:hypothetical protein
MNRRLNSFWHLALIVAAVLIIGAVTSHFVVRFLKIKATAVTYRVIGSQNGEPRAFLEGSSLTLDAVDWDLVSEKLGTGIEMWGVAGSSPSEWEVLQRRSPKTTWTFLGVSPFDLNEDFICDFRADIVPLGETLQDLLACKAGWAFSKKVVSQYALAFTRKAFPTAGRSDGVMVGIRDNLNSLFHAASAVEMDSGPRFPSVAPSLDEEKVSDWSEARIERRLVSMRCACQGKHEFNGLKRIALQRMIKRATRQGQVVVVALPVSPIYRKELLTPEELNAYQRALADLYNEYPQIQVVRIDRIEDLFSNDRFYDFVHLNRGGRQIATGELLRKIDLQTAAGVK